MAFALAQNPSINLDHDVVSIIVTHNIFPTFAALSSCNYLNTYQT